MSDQPNTPAETPQAPTPADIAPAAAKNQADAGPAKGDVSYEEIASVLSELNLTPAQIKSRLQASRKWEDFAKDKGFEEMKAKAAKFDEIEEASKTEQQRLEERAAKAEAKAAEIELRALKAEVANAKGVPAALLSGSSQEELEASADALLAFRGEKKLPDLGGGDRGSDVNAKASQLTEAEVKKLAAEGRHAEIVQAKAEGRLDAYLNS